MNKTENLKLNVWEKSDPILVGDFNENFAAIDDAIGKAGKLIKLKEYVVESDTKQFDVDVSDINWAEWQEVYIDVYVTSATENSGNISLLPNGQNVGYTQTLGVNGSANGNIGYFSMSQIQNRSAVRISFLSMQSPNHPVQTMIRQAGHFQCGFCKDYKLSDIKKITLNATQAIKSGSKVIFWGQR